MCIFAYFLPVIPSILSFEALDKYYQLIEHAKKIAHLLAYLIAHEK